MATLKIETLKKGFGKGNKYVILKSGRYGFLNLNADHVHFANCSIEDLKEMRNIHVSLAKETELTDNHFKKSIAFTNAYLTLQNN